MLGRVARGRKVVIREPHSLGGTGVNLVRRPLLKTEPELPDWARRPDAYLLECRMRMAKAAQDFAAAETRIGDLYGYWVRRCGDDAEGWINLKKDHEAIRMFAQRENSRERVRTYAALISAHLAYDDHRLMTA